VDVSRETLRCTRAAYYAVDQKGEFMERALKVGDRLGGILSWGMSMTVSKSSRWRAGDNYQSLWVGGVSQAHLAYLIPKGVCLP